MPFALPRTRGLRVLLAGSTIALGPVALSPDALAQGLRYPAGADVVDVTAPPYNAVPDDGLDDTAALNQALADHPDGNFIIYLPDGTYDVSDRINWPRVDAENDPNCGIEQACRYTVMQGQSRDGTVIRLADDAPGYGNPDARKAVIWTGAGTAQRFRNGVRTLTVHTGSGNAGAVGLQFQASNRGGLEDVLVVSGDGQGVYGIDFAYDDEIGPLLVKDVEVVGFDVGVATNFNVNSMTFEHLTLRDQNVYGMRLLQQVVTIRGLRSTNAVPAVWAFNQGSYVALIDSELNGTAGGTAIVYGSELFARNVATPGYDRAVGFLLNGTTLVGVGEDDAYVDEYVSADPLRLCVNVPRSLNLPVAETPAFVFPDTSRWANVEDFGADKDDEADDTAAIQAALDSGAEVVYFPVTSFRARTRFLLEGNVRVPATVRAVVGTQSAAGGAGAFVVESGPEPLLFQDLQDLDVDHAGDRTVVLKHASMDTYVPTSGADLFLEDVQLDAMTFRDQNVWARQVNVERGTGEQSLVNDGATLWLLGYKTEKRGVKIETTNGGRTELIGAHVYATQGPSAEPMFRSVDASVSLANVRETNFTSTPYEHLVEETRGGTTRVLAAADGTPGGIGGAGWPLYVGYVPDGPNAAPVVDAGPGGLLVLPDAAPAGEVTLTLQGRANDDGLPGTDCALPATWTQVDGPASATLSDATALDPTATFREPGTYVFRLTADDGALEASDDVTVAVYNRTITTAEGAGADARVFGPSSGGLNYGASPRLPVRRYLTFNNKVYLRFDLSDLATVDAAALVLDVATTNTGLIAGRTYNVFGLLEAESYGEGRLGEAWGEGTKDDAPGEAGELVWTNAPANTNGGGGAYDAATNSGGGVDNSLAAFLGTFSTTPGVRDTIAFRSAALTTFLQEDTNGIATLILTRVEEAGGSIAFASKEDPDGFRPPTLLVVGDAALPVFAVNAGGGAYTAADGTSYAADGGASGGRTYATQAPIAGTDDDALYQTERYGDFAYAIPVDDGAYEVTLRFAEIYWDAPGQRRFDVLAEGAPVVTGLDLVAEVGRDAAYDVTAVVEVDDGVLDLEFVTRVNNAKVSAIAVRRATATGRPPATGPGDEAYLLRHVGTGTYLDSAPRGGLEPRPLEGDADQRWRFVPAADDAYWIVNEEPGRGALDTRPDNGVRWVSETQPTGTDKLWTLEPGADGTYLIVNERAGRGYLRVDADGAVRWGDAGDGARWALVPPDDGTAPALARGSGAEDAPRAEADVPAAYALEGGYPNPFAERTTIRFGLPEAGPVRLEVFDALGRRVATLADGEQTAGWHEVAFDGAGLASGVYLYRLAAGRFQATRRVLLLR